MSNRDDNILHFRIPYKLARLPEFARFFLSSTVGTFYIHLSNQIYRKRKSQLKFFSEKGWVSELASMYEDGKLACYCVDEEIMEALYFDSRRSVQEIRRTLEELKLIKVTPFGKGNIYQLGYVVKHVDEEGFSVGSENEAHYFDRWFSYANSEDQQVVGAFRYYLAQQLAPEKKKEVILEKLGKVFPAAAQNFSTLLNLKDADSERATRVKPRKSTIPIEVSSNEVKKDIQECDIPDIVEDFAKKLLKGMTGFQTGKELRRLVTAGVPRELLSQKILDSVHESHRYQSYPLFSKQLDTQEKNAATMIMRLWTSLREDAVGVSPVGDAAQESKTLRVAINALLDAYSYDQVLWSIKNATKNKSTLEFMLKGPFTLKKVVGDSAVAYKDWVKNTSISKTKEAVQKKFEETPEAERLAYLKTLATPIEVIQSGLVRKDVSSEVEEDTYEYWMKKAESAVKLTTKTLYEQRAEAAKLREETE